MAENNDVVTMMETATKTEIAVMTEKAIMMETVTMASGDVIGNSHYTTKPMQR